MYNPTHPPIIPIFNTLVPSAVIPPSPKINACISNTIVNTKTAASGAQNTNATKHPPTMCPLVPNGIGIFIDMIAKIPAASIAISGTCLSSRFFLAHFVAK